MPLRNVTIHYTSVSGEPAAPRPRSLLRSFLAARSLPGRPPAYVLNRACAAREPETVCVLAAGCPLTALPSPRSRHPAPVTPLPSPRSRHPAPVILSLRRIPHSGGYAGSFVVPPQDDESAGVGRPESCAPFSPARSAHHAGGRPGRERAASLRAEQRTGAGGRRLPRH